MVQKTKSRRRWLIFLALLVAGIFFFIDQQNRIVTRTFTVTSARLPAAFDGLRIVQISDLHGKEFGKENGGLIRAVAALSPDLIAITGDLIDRPEHLSMLSKLARELSMLAPTYYVTGNHEWAIKEANAVKTILRAEGVTVLTNEFLSLERGGEKLVLAGIDDPNGPFDQKTPGALAGEIRAKHGDAYTLLLAHRNDPNVYDGLGFDLTLSGHGHGGMIRLPFTDGLFDNNRRRLFPSHTAGLYALEHGGILMVSRGLGSNTVPVPSFRLFNRPDLPLILLKRG